MAVVDVDAPVAPFGATVAGVLGLVPEARVWNGEAPTPPSGTYAVTAAGVLSWVEEISGAVAMTLTSWQRLSDTPVDPETTSDRDQLIEYARTVVHNGAASYLEAARHPERAQPNATSYATILWDRYTNGLDRLAAWLADRLANAEGGDTPDAEVAGGAAWSFPWPTFLDRFPV